MDIKPFRDYDEHEVINLFAVSGASINKGTFVTAIGSGFNFAADPLFQDLSTVNNAISARFNNPNLAKPAPSGTPKAQVIGMLLKDQRVVDENGLPLIYERRKREERDWIVSGETGPLVKRGLFLYSGFQGTPAFGSGLAIADAGDGSLKVVDPSASGAANNIVAIALGTVDADGYALIDIKL